MNKYSIFLTVILFVLAAFSCVLKEQKIPASAGLDKATAPETVQKSAADGWQAEWDRTLSLAKKEGKVAIFFDATIPVIVRETWAKHIKEKFGIDIEFITGRGAENSVKLLNERKAGVYTGDIFISGLTTLHLVLEPAGVFENFEQKLFLPDIVDRNLWYNGRLPWFTDEKQIFLWRLYPTKNFWINTQLIKPGEITSYQDILKPQWKGGKFVLNDPTVSGPASKWFEVYSQEPMLGVDYMKSLVKQEPVITRNLRLGTEWVAQGKYPFSIALELSSYEPFLSVGAPVAPVEMKEGSYLTSGSGNLSWIKGGPHPAAAKFFVNWLLSKEGQELTQKISKTQSARGDIAHEETDFGAFRKKGVKYYNANTPEAYKNLEPLKQLAREIFSPLTK